MGPISLETSIDAPRERVYEVVCDMGLRPSFTDHFQKDYRLARIESSGSGAAARFKVSPPGPGRLSWVETVIAEAERPRLVLEHGRCGRVGRIPMVTSWEILAGEQRTEVRLTFETEPGNALDRIGELGTEGWYKRQWRKALRRLGELVEGDQPVHRVDVAGGDRATTGVF